MVIKDDQGEWLVEFVYPEFRDIMVVSIINKVYPFRRVGGDHLSDLLPGLMAAIAICAVEVGAVQMDEAGMIGKGF
jgi:hypothetical protein